MRNTARIASPLLALSLVAGLAGCGGGGSDTPAASAITVVAAGDIAKCFAGSTTPSGAMQTAALVQPGDAVVLAVGDIAYDSGTPAEFSTCFDPAWGRFKDRIRPVPGNHDYRTAGAEGYFSYFGALAGAPRRGFYSFDLGGWHIIAIDSVIDVSEQSVQVQWLKDDLATSGSLCTIVYWHYPSFSSGPNGNNAMMRPMFDVLQAAGVELVLSGHDHIYERFAPQRGDGTPDPARGVRQFVVGTGGAPLYDLGTPVANSVFRYNGSWGVLRLTLRATDYSWQFVPVGGGAPLDAGSAECHR